MKPLALTLVTLALTGSVAGCDFFTPNFYKPNAQEAKTACAPKGVAKFNSSKGTFSCLDAPARRPHYPDWLHP